jgi:hypothetical protein
MGIENEMFLRLLTLAPLTWMASSGMFPGGDSTETNLAVFANLA